jgi:hypothetical protein
MANFVPIMRPDRSRAWSMLGPFSRISHIRDLLQFFSTTSITSYESLYGSGSVDWGAVEGGLLLEMFEGWTSDEVLRG